MKRYKYHYILFYQHLEGVGSIELTPLNTTIEQLFTFWDNKTETEKLIAENCNVKQPIIIGWKFLYKNRI